ncbi:MAG: ABC-type lipoprotein export system ATPase subunit [Pirellulaceae bacterium]|jgi:ABC-type lipoprotein export system ATPase subunit
MLSVTNLKKSFVEPSGRPLPILDIPKFDVATAEQMVLLGRSGCGKSTLLHVIAGISRADEGTIAIDGIEVSGLSEAGRDSVRAAKLGYVFQTFNLLPGFTALENVQLGMTFGRRPNDVARALMLLDRVGLSDRMSHRPSALSVGEQQRVAVARALANRPRLLLADEPTANVDPANQQHIIDLIRETCREENIALILVTHSMEVANQFDRTVQMHDLNEVLKPKSSST